MTELVHLTEEALTPESPEIVLFPQPGGLISHALNNKDWENSMNAIVTEYLSILETLESVWDPKRISLVQTDVIFGKRNPLDGSMQFKQSTAPDVPGFRSIRLNQEHAASSQPERLFLRDLFTNVNGELFFIDPDPSPGITESGNVYLSPLGEGGKVILAGHSMVVSEDLWKNPKTARDLKLLRERGYRVVSLPRPNPSLGNFVEGHIDGHVNLLTGKDGNAYLLYARSYARQEAGCSKKIRSAAEFIGAEAIEINDTGLPPLAFNFVQLGNGVVLLSGSADLQELEKTISDIVGVENLTVTDVPISTIPSLAKGGIRCMINSAPQSLINMFNPTIVSEYSPLE